MGHQNTPFGADVLPRLLISVGFLRLAPDGDEVGFFFFFFGLGSSLGAGSGVSILVVLRLRVFVDGA